MTQTPVAFIAQITTDVITAHKKLNAFFALTCRTSAQQSFYTG